MSFMRALLGVMSSVASYALLACLGHILKFSSYGLIARDNEGTGEFLFCFVPLPHNVVV